MDLNLASIAVSVVVAPVLSGAWYAAWGDRLATLSPAYADPQGGRTMTAVVELVRNAVVVAVLSGLVDAADADDLPKSWLLALCLWLGFPAVLLAGSVFHEKVPAQLAAIHAGDWLLKMLAVATIVGAWQWPVP